MQGIYKIRNKINGKYYVGSSIDIEGRWKTHLRHLKRRSHFNAPLQNAWNKYGIEKFAFEFIEEIQDADNLKVCEQEYLDKGFELEILYNVAKDATAPMRRQNHTEETKIKMCEANKGEKNGMYGKNHSDETKREQSRIRNEYYETHEPYWLGKHHTKEAKQKIGKIHKGKVISQERREELSVAMSGEKNPFFGEHHTEKTKQRIGKANSRPYPAFHNEKTGEYICAGRNLAGLCREYNLTCDNIRNLKNGATKLSRDGWRLATEVEINEAATIQLRQKLDF